MPGVVGEPGGRAPETFSLGWLPTAPYTYSPVEDNKDFGPGELGLQEPGFRELRLQEPEFRGFGLQAAVLGSYRYKG